MYRSTWRSPRAQRSLHQSRVCFVFLEKSEKGQPKHHMMMMVRTLGSMNKLHQQHPVLCRSLQWLSTKATTHAKRQPKATSTKLAVYGAKTKELQEEGSTTTASTPSKTRKRTTQVSVPKSLVPEVEAATTSTMSPPPPVQPKTTKKTTTTSTKESPEGEPTTTQDAANLAVNNKNSMTPRSIREIFNHTLTTSGPLERQMQHVQGYIDRNDRYKKSYSGFYYDHLVDPNDRDVSLTIRIPEHQYTKLFSSSKQTGTNVLRHLVNVNGFLARKVTKTCTIQMVFEVTQVAVIEQPKVLSKQELARLDLLRRRSHQPRDTSVAELLKKKLMKQEEEPRLLFITGENSIVDQDVKKGLGEDAATKYSLIWKRVNLSNPGPLQQLLADETSHRDNKGRAVHVIVVVRGGGDGLEVFNDPSLCETALEQCKLPIITALGHATDESLLDDMADSNFATPTEVGAWLKELAIQTQREMDTSELLLKQKVEKERRQERERQKEAQAALLQQLEQGIQQGERLLQEKRALEEQMTQQSKSASGERQELQQQLDRLTTQSSKERDDLQQQFSRAMQEVKDLQEQFREATQWKQYYALVAGGAVVIAAVMGMS